MIVTLCIGEERTLSVENDRIGRGTLVDEVAERLRVLLSTGEIKPGDRIRIRELQERFGVSHIPIREALRTLESEGLVASQPQKGAVATPLSLALLDEIYDARRLLEPTILERAVTKFEADDLTELEQAMERMERAEKRGFSEFFEAHRNFHWALLRPGTPPILERMLRQLWAASERFIRISKVAYPTDVAVARRQHRQLRTLVSRRDGKCGAVLERHLHLTQDTIRAHYAELGEASVNRGRRQPAGRATRG